MTEIYSIAVDLKLPEDGKVRILELMPTHHAGSSGYNMIEDHDHMQDDIIKPYLQKLAGARHFFVPDDIDTNLYKALCDHFATVTEMQGGVLYPLRMGGGQYYARIMRDELEFCLQHKDSIDMVNGGLTFLGTIDNKALAGEMVARDAHGARDYCDSFVPSVMLPTQYHRSLTGRIMDSLGKHETYVIKPVEASQGSGVRVVSAGNLDKTLKKILVDLRKYERPKAGKDYWRSDNLPVFLVQPYIASKPVAGAEQNTKRKYDGTMRVFMTLHRENEGDAFKAEIHDAYWKLPRKSVSALGRQSKTVSHSPSRPESLTFRNYLRDVFNRAAATINSAPVAKEDKDVVFAQLSDAVPLFMRDLLSKNMYDRTAEFLFSDDATEQSLGVLMATEPQYFAGGEDELLPRDERIFPVEFCERIKEFAVDPDHPSYSYLRIFAHSLAARPAGLARDLNDFYRQQKDRGMMNAVLSLLSSLDR